MTDRVRTILQGAGSLLDIFPETGRYQELVPKGTVAERLGGHWERVGQHIAAATRQFGSEEANAASKEKTPSESSERR